MADMQGAELASMLKSSVQLKSLDGIDAPWLKLSDAQMTWWNNAKLGFFFHWGLYSLLGRGEWVMFNESIPVDQYRRLADRFNPSRFDPARWAELAKEAGMKYAVMVTRHHDGFAMWDSPGSYGQFHSAASAAKTDFVQAYSDAFREAGLKLGLYYSPMDWRFPGYFQPREMPENAALMKQQAYNQIEELMTRYGTIDVLWYDGSWLAHQGTDADAAWFWEPVRLNEMVRRYQPNCVINPRSGWTGDFQCDEGPHEITGEILPFPWEKNFSISRYWSHDAEDRVLPIETIVKLMVDTFVRGGNVLLNAAPTPDGEISPNQVMLLKQIGDFMRANGEAIYDTQAGPLQPVDHVYGTTHKQDVIYLHVTDMKAFKGMVVPLKPDAIQAAACLNGRSIAWHDADNGVVFEVPTEEWKQHDTVIKVTCRGQG